MTGKDGSYGLEYALEVRSLYIHAGLDTYALRSAKDYLLVTVA
jgi:hypothetical protein